MARRSCCFIAGSPIPVSRAGDTMRRLAPAYRPLLFGLAAALLGSGVPTPAVPPERREAAPPASGSFSPMVEFVDGVGTGNYDQGAFFRGSFSPFACLRDDGCPHRASCRWSI